MLDHDSIEITSMAGTTSANGETNVQFYKFDVPQDTPLEDVRAFVDEKFPEQHCQHEHDCCGHWYAGSAWLYAWVGNEAMSRYSTESHTYVVEQSFNQNI